MILLSPDQPVKLQIIYQENGVSVSGLDTLKILLRIAHNIEAFETKLLDILSTRGKQLLEKIDTTKAISEENEKQLGKFIEDAKSI